MILLALSAGKTNSYAIPIVGNCVQLLLGVSTSGKRIEQRSTSVHGLVLVPTRELAIQVSKEFKVASKVANKYMAKCAVDSSPSLVVESLAIYGGVDIESQMKAIEGGDGDSSSCHRSLVVCATAGRLLDILKQSETSADERDMAAKFANLRAIVFDEADRIAVNADMSGQIDEILSILKDARVSGGIDVVSCLVSATLPEKAKAMCEKWVPRPRVVVKVDSVHVGGKRAPDQSNAKANGSEKDGDAVENSCEEVSGGKESVAKQEGDDKKRSAAQNLDFSTIPSNIVQTIHVCANHKKPKKLITTLQRIYMKKDLGGRFTVNNRLTIVFFGQIKTVKYISKLLVKEGLKCVELYGSLNQADREKRLLDFKAGKTPILLATDVAARYGDFSVYNSS